MPVPFALAVDEPARPHDDPVLQRPDHLLAGLVRAALSGPFHNELVYCLRSNLEENGIQNNADAATRTRQSWMLATVTVSISY